MSKASVKKAKADSVETLQWHEERREGRVAKISVLHYGDPARYDKIYEANKDKLPDSSPKEKERKLHVL